MRQRERGGAVIIVMLIIAATLAASALLTSMQSTSSHASAMARTQITGLYCAEAGLAAARATVIANVAVWDPSLGAAAEPAWLGAISHDIDSDGANDFRITLRDNDDEPVNDLTRDADQTVFIVSTCIKHSDSPTQVTELVTSTGQRKLWLETE
ncbi:MAG: hypothetical protein H0T65_23915 [Deltaproteobacteria bacterium]|nr:hypothetical protein [Deltaproteobacteria bacterium]